ncbi:MAG TPA: hypothetical protein VK909_02335 [Anaerolineales bacterium]|nr:hypothetical protein [Anaerolineales bacterium]
MSILITFLILLLTALTLIALRIMVPGFRYSWLFAVGGTFFAWLSVISWQIQFPINLQFASWQPATLFTQAPTFIADRISWLFVFSLVSLGLAILITAAVRPHFPSPASWAGTLVLTALGMMAVVANNPLTLVLIWAAIDLVELVVQIWYVEDPKMSERVVIAFASRATGILFLLWADVVGAAGGQLSDFRLVTPQAGVYLLIAAGLRVGVLPLHLPYASESALRRGFGTGLRMVSAASSLILLARIPAASIASPITPYLLILVALAGVYGGWMWLRAPDELTARPFWLIGMGALVVAAALRSNPIGAAAWSCALVLTGGALFLFSEQNRWLTRALYIGAFGVSSLPFSITATGWNSGDTGFWLAFPFLLLAHAMLIAGFIRHAQRTNLRTPNEDQPIWGKNVYPFGILLLLVVTAVLGVFGWDGALQFGNWLAGMIVSSLTVVILWLTPRLRILNPVRAHWVRPTSASWLDWAYELLWSLYRQLGRVSNTFSSLLEGESGIMWTLLFLVLFMTVFAHRNP